MMYEKTEKVDRLSNSSVMKNAVFLPSGCLLSKCKEPTGKIGKEEMENLVLQ